MARFRSTKLSLFLNRCPHAVSLYERGEQWDRTVFGVGVAAHDILQALGEFPHDDREAVARSVTTRLIREGRVGHDAEGPLPADAVFAGRDIVLDWINWGGDPRPVPGLFEPGFGFLLPSWRPTSYDGADFGIHPDAVYPIRTEDGRGLVVRDYKTAWSAGADTLSSLQLRAQAVAVWKAAEATNPRDWPGVTMPERWFFPDFIRREVVSLQLRDSWHEDTWLDAEGVYQLNRWATDIETVVEALDVWRDQRPPRVGRHCLTCPFQHACDAWNKVSPIGRAADLKDVADVLVDDFILSTANTNRLESLVREVTDDGPVERLAGELGGIDTVVGTVGVTRTKVDTDAAAVAIVDTWFERVELDAGARSAVVGMLKAMQPGVTQLKALAKVAWPRSVDDFKSKRARFVDAVTSEKIERRFGIWDKDKVKP